MNNSKQLSLFNDPEICIDFNREPSNNEICMMCHFSSECNKCCKTCKDQCNSCQQCQIGEKEQSDRLAAWMDIVIKNEIFTHLKKFINDC